MAQHAGLVNRFINIIQTLYINYPNVEGGPPLARFSVILLGNVELDEVVVDGGAWAHFDAVADFVAEGVEGVRGAQSLDRQPQLCAARGVFATLARLQMHGVFHEMFPPRFQHWLLRKNNLDLCA